jgi:hypothetical protein
MAPHRPVEPAVAVVVFIRMLGVIHDNSPGGATTISPGSSASSRTGSKLPEISDCIAFLYVLEAFQAS